MSPSAANAHHEYERAITIASMCVNTLNEWQAREVLEKFLNDDDDMHDFNITANRDRENALQEERMRSLQVGDTLLLSLFLRE